MFVGHYGPSFAAKAFNKSVPLWVLFLAVQLLDVFWAIFVLLGIEKVRIVPGITAANPLDFYYMPYTHSLAAAILWSLATVVVYRLLPVFNNWPTAGLLGAAVFSHWVLDFLVHRPDLPLYDDVFKVGLGLWNYPLPALALEAALLVSGLYLYLRAARSAGRGGLYRMVIFGFVMLAIQSIIFFGPPPSSDKATAVTALVSYFLLAGIAYWLDRKRDIASPGGGAHDTR